MFKNLKKWKTIVQFVITVLTAVVSSFLTQSCKNCKHPTNSSPPIYRGFAKSGNLKLTIMPVI